MKNVITQNTYQNTNLEALQEVAEERGYTAIIWGTFPQWKNVGRTVKKGEKGTVIIKVVKTKMINQQGEEVPKKVVRRYTIFNLEQTTELEK